MELNWARSLYYSPALVSSKTSTSPHLETSETFQVFHHCVIQSVGQAASHLVHLNNIRRPQQENRLQSKHRRLLKHSPGLKHLHSANDFSQWDFLNLSHFPVDVETQKINKMICPRDTSTE